LRFLGWYVRFTGVEALGGPTAARAAKYTDGPTAARMGELGCGESADQHFRAICAEVASVAGVAAL
jgi:hypothetical protein